MKLEISANNIIDLIIPLLDDIETFYAEARQAYPKGIICIDCLPGKLKTLHEMMCTAEKKIAFASNVLQISMEALYDAAKTARKWHRMTQWQFCLSEDMAEKILKTAITHKPKKLWR